MASADFCFEHLGGLKTQHTANFRKSIQETYSKRKSMTYDEAVEAVRDVVMKSTNTFSEINATTVVMEFVCAPVMPWMTTPSI